MTQDQLEIACSLTGAELADRGAAWSQVIAHWGLARRALPDRVRLTFQPASGVLPTLQQLVELEAACCPWMRFDLRDEDPVVLDVTADGDGLAAVRLTFEAT
jgi:hypothetical protein